MKTRYSKTTGTFYPFDENYSSLPTDVQIVELADYETVNARPVGASFSFSESGTLSITLPPVPTAAQLLAQAMIDQIVILTSAYQTAIQQSVTYTSIGGVTKSYQADPRSVANLMQMLIAFQKSATAPFGFYWVSADNTQVHFIYADMQNLAAAMGGRGFSAFQHLQDLKSNVNAATTITAVQGIVF